MKNNYYVGIDIGGTNTAVGIVDSEGRVLARDSFPTRSGATLGDYIDTVATTIDALGARTSIAGKIKGIGIGAPNVGRHREISLCENLPWEAPVPLADLVAGKTGLPVEIANDANAAAVGEMTYGNARGMSDFIMITLGTGVGSAVVADGRLLCGHRGFAGELGHVAVRHSGGRACGCGKTGCLEAYCSATGIAATAREKLAATPERASLLRSHALGSITAKDVYDAAVEGDALAKDVFDFTGEILGHALADFTTFSDPEAFILFGGPVKSGDLLLKPLKESFRKHLMPLWTADDIKILVSGLDGSDAAILGAAALACRAAERM